MLRSSLYMLRHDVRAPTELRIKATIVVSKKPPDPDPDPDMDLTDCFNFTGEDILDLMKYRRGCVSNDLREALYKYKISTVREFDFSTIVFDKSLPEGPKTSIESRVRNCKRIMNLLQRTVRSLPSHVSTQLMPMLTMFSTSYVERHREDTFGPNINSILILDRSLGSSDYPLIRNHRDWAGYSYDILIHAMLYSCYIYIRPTLHAAMNSNRYYNPNILPLQRLTDLINGTVSRSLSKEIKHILNLYFTKTKMAVCANRIATELV